MALELKLPFPVLSDSRRELIVAWGLLNEKEMGGIALPSVFVIDDDLTVRFRSLDKTNTRASAADVAAIVDEERGATGIGEVVRRKIRPGLMFLRAISNSIRRGVAPWSR